MRYRLVVVTAAVLTALTSLSGQVATPAAQTVDIQLLAFNDFHGALEPAAGGNGRIGQQDAGGIEFFATHLARLKQTNPNTFVVSGGDNIGGTPLLSSLSHDEATVEALNAAGLQLSAVGNHELDEGWWELLRVAAGGCHPVDGCQDGTPFGGASFEYLAANITLDPRRADPAMLARAGVTGMEQRLLFPGYAIKQVAGVRIGFIGIVLQEAPGMIIPASTRGLIFRPEADAANEAAAALRQQGVRAIVVLLHEGGTTTSGDINGCEGMSSELTALANQLADDIDVIVSGHTHRAYNCTIDGKLVTSASSLGRVVTDIDLRVARDSGEVVGKTARNLVVTRDVPRDPAQTALIAHYRPVAEEIGGRVVGTIAASLLRAPNDAGESALGDVIADAFLEAARRTPGGEAEIAFTNIGGIRADIPRPADAAAPSPVTYSQLFDVSPFGNTVMTKTLTGQAILDALEQQFGAESTRIIQVSRGFTFAYDPSRPRGQRIDRSSVRINGVPIVADQQYRVATTDFLWTRGDGYEALATGTEGVTVGVDVDVVAEYFSRNSPVAPGPQNRIRLIR
jgi:5'-nucleotidase